MKNLSIKTTKFSLSTDGMRRGVKKLLLLLTLTFTLLGLTKAQEYATFTLTGEHQGTGTFENATLSDFIWLASGTLAQEVQILDDEVFDDGSQFEDIFGQADFEQNLRIQLIPNGSGTSGLPITSSATLTINFDQNTPAYGWGFCVVDIDVENCLISAIDQNDNEVTAEDIDDWLIELFDTDSIEDGLNIPKWDAAHAALLGADTPEDYVVYDNLVIGGMPSSEAPAAFFMPDIPLKSLIIDLENLQEDAFVSYHFYIASLFPTAIPEKMEATIGIYPNPASTIVQINLAYSPVKQNDSKNIILYNVLGKIISQTELTDNKLTLDVSHLAVGVYYVKAIVDGQSITNKLIIQK